LWNLKEDYYYYSGLTSFEKELIVGNDQKSLIEGGEGCLTARVVKHLAFSCQTVVKHLVMLLFRFNLQE
jgi:hypothetical protein